MIPALTFPRRLASTADRPQVLITVETLAGCVAMLPDPRPLVWRDHCPRPTLVDRLIDFAFVVGAVTRHLLEWPGELIEHIAEGHVIGDTVLAQHTGQHLVGRFVDAQMQTPPGAARAGAMEADLPLTLAVDLHSRGIDDQMQRCARVSVTKADLQGLAPSRECREVGHRQLELHQRDDRE